MRNKFRNKKMFTEDEKQANEDDEHVMMKLMKLTKKNN